MIEQYTKYWELFIKQKDDTISTQEAKELSAWVHANDTHSSVMREFEKIYNESAIEDNSPNFNPQHDWNQLSTMIKIEEDVKGSRVIKMFPWMARVAAAVILILGFSFLFYQYQHLPPENLNLQTIVQTDETNQEVVELPDGSKVWLNRNSELLYPESFGGDSRTLYLKGEAFFDVEHDKNKPFIIHSGSSKTKVLGTSFNLRAYSKEDKVKLTVVAGRVSFTLSDDKEEVIVTAGDAAVLINNTKTISQSHNADPNFLSWKTGELLFDDSPLDQLISSLERHYAVTITVDRPETLSCRFTGNFHETTIEDIIKVITKATGTTYNFSNGQYIIEGIGCN